LGRLIHAQIKQHSALAPLEEERLRHQEFAQRRARDFTGQAGPLGEIESYLAPTSEPATPLVVHGASGSGESALLAKAILARKNAEGKSGLPLHRRHGEQHRSPVGHGSSNIFSGFVLQPTMAIIVLADEGDNTVARSGVDVVGQLERPKKMRCSMFDHPLLVSRDTLYDELRCGQPERQYTPKRIEWRRLHYP